MVAWVLGVPAFLFLLVVVLDLLEDSVVSPMDRAEKIRYLVSSNLDEDAVAREVAKLLEPTMRRSPFDERSAAREPARSGAEALADSA